MAQVITNTSDANLVTTVAYGTLTPALSATLSSGQVQFRLRAKSNTGYHLNASATFTATTTGAVSGGTTISASDVGFGITSITTSANVITPRTDTITSGYNYDPTTASVTNGLTPYGGAASGKANLADLATSQKILSGPRIASNENTGQTNYLTVTVKLGILPQYFTPGSFTATITLTIVNGP